MTILREVHKNYDLIDLGNGLYARHCFVNGPECKSVEIIRKRGNEENGTCEPCRPLKKRRLDEPESQPDVSELHPYTRFDTMSREQLLDLLRQKQKKLRYANRQLRNARECMKKERESAFLATEDKELRDVMSKASDFVRENKDTALQGIMKALTTANALKHQAKGGRPQTGWVRGRVCRVCFQLGQ